MSYHCGTCNSQRQTTICHKCNSETFTPSAEWEYPKLPPIDKIRVLAKEVGYAIGVHGTLERDLDLIATPWIWEAVDANTLIEHICSGLDASVVGDIEQKPFHRKAVSIQMNGWYKLIDLSICPIVL